MFLNNILKKNQTKFQNLNTVLITVLCLLFIFFNYSELGVFADDIGTIYFLDKINSLKELFIYSHNWDAARDLHLIWQQLFIKISKPEIIKQLHFYQILTYIINALILFTILRQLGVEKNNSYICTIFFLFFPLYAEVVFWTHAFTMVLISTTFFLLFLLINIKLTRNLKKYERIIYNILSIIFLLLNLFTYEQAIVVSLIIILLREFILIRKKKVIEINNYISIVIYSLIIFLFSYYKLYEAGTFTKNSQLYFTGSKISNYDQFFKNIIHGYGIYILELINFNLDILKLISKEKILIFIVSVLIFIKLNSNSVSYKSYNLDNVYLKIFICFIFYTLSLLPLYIHYISDRHFYLPSIFALIGMGLILNIFSKINFKKKFFKIIFSSCVCLFLLNTMVNFDNQREQYIENYKLKKNFYKNLSNIEGIKNRDFIVLMNFPDLYKKTIFFAHEQVEAMKFKLKNENYPLILKNEELNKKNSIYVKFIKIYNNNIVYESYASEHFKTTKN